jgi:hypothetical protein
VHDEAVAAVLEVGELWTVLGVAGRDEGDPDGEGVEHREADESRHEQHLRRGEVGDAVIADLHAEVVHSRTRGRRRRHDVVVGPLADEQHLEVLDLGADPVARLDQEE